MAGVGSVVEDTCMQVAPLSLRIYFIDRCTFKPVKSLLLVRETPSSGPNQSSNQDWG